MNRRRFLGVLVSSFSLSASLLTAWGIGFQDHTFSIPEGVDTVGERISNVPSLEQWIDGDVRSSANRTLALYIMYATHLSKPYGEAPQIETVQEFLQLDYAHCGDFSVCQHALNQQYGLSSRIQMFADGWHSWVEVEINGQWEIFDSTTNVWVNRPMSALLQGADRLYTPYYSPALDPEAPSIYRDYLKQGWDVGALRRSEPFFGKVAGQQFAPIIPLGE